MKNLEKYKGVFPAFYACYDEKGNISPERIKQLIQYFVNKGIKGTYVCGSSGECIYQSVDERKKTLEAVMDAAAGKMTILAHVACNNTKDSIELAKHAQSVGVDAIAAIPPIYFHLPDYAMADYWNAMSDAAPDTDFVIYNIPPLAGVALTLDLFLEMKKNPRVVAVKNSSAFVQDIQLFKEKGGSDFIVYNGPDEQFTAGYAMGADGGIGGTYAVMPELFLRMDTLMKKGDIPHAMAIQFHVDAIIREMVSAKGNLYAVMKEILRSRDGIDLGGVRRPLPPLYPEDMPIVERARTMIADAIAESKSW